MKYQLPDGQVLNLKPLTDAEYELARRQAPRSLDTCPTCGGREEAIGDSGMKCWVSRTYKLNGVEHECNCQLQVALYTRYVLANIGTQYMRLDWKDFGGAKIADQWVKDYTSEWQGYIAHGFGLTFASRSQGVGKTWAATHIAKELIKHRQKVVLIDFVQMVDAFMEGDKEIERRMRDTTLVVLDDVRAGMSDRQTDLYALKFEVVVRHRTNFNLPTIFTTNLTREEFEQEFPRIYSLVASKQKWIAMNGVDHRKLSDTAEETMAMIALGEMRPIT